MSYKTLVGQSFQGFKTVYHPSSGGVVKKNGEVSLATYHAFLSHLQIKLFIPPGTKRLSIGLVTYLSNEEAKAAVCFGQPPVSQQHEITAETSHTETTTSFQILVENKGKDLRFYSPGRSGVLSISEGNKASSFITKSGDYLYFNFLSLPGSIIGNIQTFLDIDEEEYNKWYRNAVWDEEGNPVVAKSTENTQPSNDSALSVDLPVAPVLKPGSKRTVWVAAKIPATGFLFPEDSWFFLTKDGWAKASLPNPFLFCFSEHSDNKVQTVSIGIPESTLHEFNVEIHCGYKDSDAPFVNQGKVWPK